jgi:hypothetical protein
MQAAAQAGEVHFIPEVDLQPMQAATTAVDSIENRILSSPTSAPLSDFACEY